MTTIYTKKIKTYGYLCVLFFTLLSGVSAFGQCGTTYSTTQTINAFTVSTACTLTVNSGVTLTIQNSMNFSSGGSLVIQGAGSVIFQQGISLGSGTSMVTNNTGNTTITGNFGISSGATFTANGPVTFSSAVSLNGGTVNINSNSTMSQGGNYGGGTLNVQNNSTLTIDETGVNFSGSVINITSGSTIDVVGSITNNSSSIADNGTLEVTGSPGTYTGGSSTANVTGSGTFTTTGGMSSSNGGTIFGQANYTCSGPGCNGSSGCGFGVPAFSPTGSSSTVYYCASSGNKVAFTATTPSTTSGYTFQWLNNGSAISGATNNTYTTPTSPSGTYSLKVTQTSNSCASTSATVTVQSGTPATPTSISPTTTACENTATTYTVASVTGASSYNWTITTGTGSSSTTTNTNSITWTAAGSENIKVAAVSNSCTSAQLSQNITVTAAPTAPTVTGSPSSFTSCTNVVLTGSVTSGVTYQWYLGGSAISGATNNTYTATSSGSYTQTITSGSCSATSTGTVVTINSAPSAAGSITGSATVCEGQTGITYSIAAVTNATGYTWTLPTNAFISAGANTNSITVSYSTSTSNGTIQVTPTNSNGCGNGTSSSLSVTVNANPTITSTPTTICPGVSVTFNISSPVSGTYTWLDNGASTGSTGTSLTVGSPVAGASYTATLTNGGCTTSASNAIVVSSLPVAGSITGTVTVCEGQTGITYSITALANATGYAWTLPTGGSPAPFISGGANTNSITVSFAGATTSGTVQVTPSNSCGTGTASPTFSVTVNPTPVITSSPTTVCPGVSTTFSISSPVSGTYTWLKNTVSTGSTGTSLTVASPVAADSYTATLTGGGCTTPASSAIVVNSLPSAAGSITGSASVCAGQTGVTYSIAAVTNATGYNWTLPTGGSPAPFISGGSNTDVITVSYQGATSTVTSGSVQVTPTNACGNGTASPALAITVNAIPAAPTSISPTTTAALGSAITYTETGGGGTSYLWTITGGTGSGSASTNSITWSTAGAENIQISAIANSCTSSVFSQNITVTTASSWMGTTNTDWATASNWSPAFVPTSLLTVTIQSVPNKPIISSSTIANCNGITINASSSLTLASGRALNVYGNYVNNGTVTDNGGTTSFQGSTAQTFSGPSGGTTLSSLTLNNSSGLTLNNPLTVGGSLSVGGVLTLTSGTITSNGKLTVNLFLGGISGAGTGAISGNLTVTKFVDTTGYHYISAPIPNCTVSDIDASLGYSTEYFGNLFWYNEANPSSNDLLGWTNVNNTTNYSAYPSLTQMQGFALYFFGSGTLSYTKAYTTNNYSSTINLTSTNSGTSSSDGWNLVGNPYPSSIDWNASPGWTKTDIDNSVYYYNPATGNYASYVLGAGTNGGTNIIPSMQGFWVHVSTDPGSGSLTVTNSARSTVGSSLLWRNGVALNSLSIVASASGDSSQDESIVRILPEATDGFDPCCDAYKLMSDAGSISLFSKAGKDSLSVNSLSDTTANFNVPLLIGTPAGSYTFTFNGAASFQNYDVILTDNLSNTYQDLKQNPTYSFSLTGTDTVSRFFLNLRKAGTLTANGITSTISGNTINNDLNVIINNNNNGVIINFVNTISNTADLTLFNILGEDIWENKNTDISSGNYSINSDAFPSGIYILRVTIDSKTYSKKIYLIK